jgi:cytochrome b561
MAGSNRKFQYTIAKVLHWVAGFVIAFNLLSGWKIGDFTSAQKVVLIMIHSGLGVTIFLMMLFRWWWRRSRNLYTPPRWYVKPSMLLQWIFYPLVLIQVLIGVVQAGYIDYEVLAFGFINFSALAVDNEQMHGLFLQLHGLTAAVLILLIVIHGVDKGRTFFVEDSSR